MSQAKKKSTSVKRGHQNSQGQAGLAGAGLGAADPAFAAIAKHWLATRAYSEACHADHPDEDLVKRTGDIEVDARDDLLKCRPTTLAGVGALLAHLGQPDYGDETENTVLSGAIEFDGPIKAAANKLPKALAAVIFEHLDRTGGWNLHADIVRYVKATVGGQS